jgi:hypothetical protein
MYFYAHSALAVLSVDSNSLIVNLSKSTVRILRTISLWQAVVSLLPNIGSSSQQG